MRATVIYGTDSGNTRNVAEQIAMQMGGKAIEVGSANRADFEECDLLILGTPTCGYGDLQCDWDGRLSFLAEADLTGKNVALFGLGDQLTYADTFVDGMGVLYEALTERGIAVIGTTSVEEYDFYSSRAVRDNCFVGLVLDEDIQPHRTEERIASWVAFLKRHLVGESATEQTQPEYAR